MGAGSHCHARSATTAAAVKVARATIVLVHRAEHPLACSLESCDRRYADGQTLR